MTIKISLTRENAKHIANLNDEMGEVRDEISGMNRKVVRIETDVCWLKKFFFIIATSSIGSLIILIFQALR